LERGAEDDLGDQKQLCTGFTHITLLSNMLYFVTIHGCGKNSSRVKNNDRYLSDSFARVDYQASVSLYENLNEQSLLFTAV